MRSFLFQRIPSWIGILVVTLGASSLVLAHTERRALLLESKQKNAEAAVVQLNGDLLSLKQSFEALVGQNTNLTTTLEEEKDKNVSLAKQFTTVKKTVGTLQKLSETDPQLLQKYSKVYFLNENYTPLKLSFIDEDYLSNKESELQIHSKVAPYLRDLIEEAADDSLTIRVVSAYRSFGSQAALKSSYRVLYGTTKANQFSADQGYSEHQLGTTLDFTTPTVGSTFVGFDKTPEYAWLLENAYRYGFVISYPENNTYYQFEPWHWRFVGVTLATELHKQGKYFYDMDQRQIDAYLVSLFD